MFDAVSLTTSIVAAAVMFQTIELLLLRGTFQDASVWSWPILRNDFDELPGIVRQVADGLLRYPNFVAVLWLRLIAASCIVIMPHVIWSLILIGTTTLIALRWRGSFNGGSDSMTLVVLVGLTLALMRPSSSVVVLAGMAYIAVQLVLSYFIAGIVKLKHRTWRSGKALQGFVTYAAYSIHPWLKDILEQRVVGRAVNWAVILFECSFPLALMSPRICLIYISLAALFHLGNVYVFGLNRFAFAWAAAYPALYLCALEVSRRI